MIFDCLKDVEHNILYLRNDDFGWGEFKTQVSRLTNTCEAVWALGRLAPASDISGSLEFIRRGVRGENNYSVQNCEIARDFAWALMALSAASSTEVSDGEVSKCISAISAARNITHGGFGSRTEPESFSVFCTSFVLVSLITYLRDYAGNRADEKLASTLSLEIIRKIIEGQNSDGGWGEKIGGASHPSYTAYALYAISLYGMLGVSPDGVKESAIKYLKKSDIASYAASYDCRPDNRPYRHFTMAWALLAMSEIKIERQFAAFLANILIKQKIEGHGWNIDKESGDKESGSGVPTTWATAIAARALGDYFSNSDFSVLIAMIDGGNRSGVLSRSAARIRAFWRHRPTLSKVLLIVAPIVISMAYHASGGFAPGWLLSFVTMLGFYYTFLGTTVAVLSIKSYG